MTLTSVLTPNHWYSDISDDAEYLVLAIWSCKREFKGPRDVEIGELHT